ncbi:8-amino-7-oxononanoate synthase [bacterium]|nr:8-amino-7-oxononanoate synthase [bacterium]
MPFPLLSWIDDELASLMDADLYRARRVIEKRVPGRITVDGIDYLDVSSNDYLGLAADPRIIDAAREVIEEMGFGAAASPLVSGYTKWHQKLEREIARFEGTESAVVFPSGFAANLGTITSLVGPDDLIFSDVRNHASLIDGCRLSKASIRRFDGREIDSLRVVLQDAKQFRRRLIVTDSVFSMDGDVAPLDLLAEIAHESDSMLYVDEAHATGVLGKTGSGACELLGVKERVSIRMGTLSKALGGMGGFVAGSKDLCDWLINRSRSYIYSTGFPAAAAAAACRAIEIVADEPERSSRVNQTADDLRTELAIAGFSTGSSRTPIVPLILGESTKALAFAEQLRHRGVMAVAIRPPTVPPGTARIRLSISAAHESDEIQNLVSIIVSVAKSLS